MSKTFQIITVAFCYMLFLGVAFYVSADFSTGVDTSTAVLKEQILQEVNIRRDLAGVPRLSDDPLLSHIAQQKADMMAMRSEFSHTLRDGTTAWSLIDAAGYQYTAAGENLAVYFVSAPEVVQAWYDSPAHRENLLSSLYTVSGIGITHGTYNGYPGYFMVQLFAEPY